MITPQNKFFNQQWGLYLIKAPQAWTLLMGNPSPLNGSAAEIAFGDASLNMVIVDYGVETINKQAIHKGFLGNTSNGRLKLLHIVNDVNTFFDFKDVIKGNHGMEVAGVAASKAKITGVASYNGEGVIGVAPNISLYSLLNTSLQSSLKGISFMHALCGLEKTITGNVNVYINKAYGITSDEVSFSPLYKELGTTDEKKPLSFFLNNSYADIISISKQIIQATGQLGENNIIVYMSEINAYARNGRGAVAVIGAGNNGKDIEPTTNQFLNEYAASNKPIIVGAVSVDNGYNWLTNSPLAHARKSNYSNFGNRIDVCAPGGGENPGLPLVNPGTQDANTIYSTAIRGAGVYCADNPLVLNLKTKTVDTTTVYPSSSPLHASVFLEFDNVNGIRPNQKMIIGSFTGLNNFHVFDVDSINSYKVKIKDMPKTLYTGLVDTSGAPTPRTPIEFTPFFTKVKTASTGTTIEVEDIKGAFIGADIYVGSLGSASSGTNCLIMSGGINVADKKLTLNQSVTVAQGDNVVFPMKRSKVVMLNNNGTKVIKVQDIEGYFVGADIIIESFDPTKPFKTSGNITSIDVPSRTLTFDTGLVFDPPNPPSNPLSGPQLDFYASNYNAGDITDFFNGTSAATPFVAGVAALVLSANRYLSSAEVKHIIKKSASSTDTVVSATTQYVLNLEGYMHSVDFGTGIVDAEAAVQMALGWHTNPARPILRFFDNDAGTAVPLNQPVVSPDVWLKPITETALPIPSASQPYNSFETAVDQKIFIRVRNTGGLKTFKECDVRVLVAFTDDVNPSFPFPDKWYTKIDSAPVGPTIDDNVVLLGVKSIPSIAVNSSEIVEFEWTGIQEVWSSWNPLNKKAYLLIHIAPFDGVNTDLSLTNLRGNKNLSCLPINVTHFRGYKMVDGTKTPLPKDVYNLAVNPILESDNFIFEISNILSSRLDTLKFTFEKKNILNVVEQTVIYRKASGTWSFDVQPTGDWVKALPPIAITNSTLSTPDYKNATLSFTLAFEMTKQITFDVKT